MHPKYDRYTDEQLIKEYKEMRRAVFGIHGNNARRELNLIVDVLLARGVTMEPNIFGDIPIRHQEDSY